MRRPLAAVVLTTCLAVPLSTAAPAGATSPPRPGARADLTLALFGDAPYGLSPTDDSQLALLPDFVAQVNADPDVDQLGFVGDIHSGKQYCTPEYDRAVAQAWSRFARPLIYTPGDNEWADCHKPGEGGGKYNPATATIDYVADGSYAHGDPVANLALVRSTFFPTPGATLGGGRLRVTSQATAYDRRHPEDRAYVENVRWEAKDVVFLTLNIPGGSNDDTDPWYGTATVTPAQTAEVATRSAANLRWLESGFALARAGHARAVVVLEQADMWDVDGKSATHLSNYEPYVAALAQGASTFGGPVLLVNGDSHAYRSDNPFDPQAPCVTESSAGEVACTENLGLHPGYTVPNFHRIVVHGSTSPLEWLKLTVEHGCQSQTGTVGTNAFGPFRWVRMSTGLVGAS